MNYSPINILVTGCFGVTARAIARSIKYSQNFCNSRLIGVDMGKNQFGLHEGLYQKCYKVPPAKNNLLYFECIKKIIKNEGIDMAIVVPELEVIEWCKEELSLPVILPSLVLAENLGDKMKLYSLLKMKNRALVPNYEIFNRKQILSEFSEVINFIENKPIWIRDFEIGSSSGKGSLLVSNIEELKAWVVLNKGINQFMLSEYLPGRNFAQCILYHEGEMLAHACYERLSYFMGHLVPSGISGNIDRGKLIFDQSVLTNADSALKLVADFLGEKLHGIFTIDLKGNEDEKPLITEVNLRHTAATSLFAAGGVNMVESQIYATLNMKSSIKKNILVFNDDNLLLRDIDGIPRWISTGSCEINYGEEYPSLHTKLA